VPANLRHNSLQLLAKIFKDDIPDNARNDSDTQIRQEKNILDGKRKTLAVAVGPREFAHQKVGVKQENDKADLDNDLSLALQFLDLRSSLARGNYSKGFPHVDTVLHAKATSAASSPSENWHYPRFEPYKIIME
jgi:hypothetical protein